MTTLSRPAFALRPVLLIAAVATIGLLLLAQWHGFHRDELYFIVAGRNPAFGYPDQPPLAPLLAALGAALLGVEPLAVRVLPALTVGIVIVLTAAMARDLGGDARAQTIAAVTIALSGLLAAGHLGSTATYELLLWTALLWVTVKLLRGADPRLWLVAGLIGGIALQNKQTALVLGVGLAGGLLLARRWDVLRTPWLWAGGLLAALTWAPNVIWQASNGWPQLEMARAISERIGDERAMVVPELILLAGPLLFPVLFAGLWRLTRDADSKPWRALPAAFLISLALVIVSGGKSYYAAAYFGPLIAAGAISTDAWLARGRQHLRGFAFAGAAVVSGLLMVVLTLPVLPPPILADTPIPELYAETAEQVGWPELVAEVERATGTLSDEERAAAVIFTANYGEAGAVELLGGDLPPVYSGHNGYGFWGPPPEEAVNTVVIGHWDTDALDRFGTCASPGTVDNGIGLENQEQGAGVWVCRDRATPWQALWPELRHLD